MQRLLNNRAQQRPSVVLWKWSNVVLVFSLSLLSFLDFSGSSTVYSGICHRSSTASTSKRASVSLSHAS